MYENDLRAVDLAAARSTRVWRTNHRAIKERLPVIDTPQIVQTTAQPTACIHLVIPREEALDARAARPLMPAF
jgi:hypothetical protein